MVWLRNHPAAVGNSAGRRGVAQAASSRRGRAGGRREHTRSLKQLVLQLLSLLHDLLHMHGYYYVVGEHASLLIHV